MRELDVRVKGVDFPYNLRYTVVFDESEGVVHITYPHWHDRMQFWAIISSSATINTLVITGPKGDPIHTPSTCL